MMYGLVQLGGCILSAAFYARICWGPVATYRTDFFKLRGCGDVMATCVAVLEAIPYGVVTDVAESYMSCVCGFYYCRLLFDPWKINRFDFGSTLPVVAIVLFCYTGCKFD